MTSKQKRAVEHIISSSIGGTITVFVVTPLDVVKTRLQSQTAHAAPSPFPARFSPALPASASHTAPFRGTFDALVKIARHEGVARLWRGLQASLAMQLPGSAIYFTIYERSKRQLDAGYFTPMLAGSIARTITVLVTSPLDMFRTNLQSHNRHVGALQMLQRMAREKRIGQLWAGLKPTLYRDVPFSALYWSGYESLKYLALTRTVMWQEGFALNFLSGAIAGSFAALATVPFDVVKTRMQMNVDKPGYAEGRATVLQTLVKIGRQEGLAGLTRGVVPRVAKIGPSCAIFVSSYEYMKQFFFLRQQQQLFA